MVQVPDICWYFAYGSNMASARITHRVASARALGAARLDRHRLTFAMQGGDGSAKCDIEASGHNDDVVYGVVFELAAADKPILDSFERLHEEYEEKPVTVYLDDGQPMAVFTYYAIRHDASLIPYDWYKRHVVKGAKEHGLPDDYVAWLEATPAKADTDSDRRDREGRIYEETGL